ncbi:MAG: hypothetical protein L0387_41310 [Acidobacteria bacterium]|nr:hypothetical protein [Acidobacteriota bacterium]
MKRSSGITASAVIAILGSVFTILLGGFAVLSAMVMRAMPNLSTPPGQPAPPVPVGAILIAESIFFLGFGAWGIASAVGLLRLKDWARVCFLVYAGLLTVFSIFGALFMLLFLVVGLPMPPQQHLPPGFMTGILSAMIFFELMLVTLGVWWLFYFNRRDVKTQFMGEAAAALPSRRPLSIIIIAWMLIVGGLFSPFYLLFSYPAVFFGFALRGWAARLTYFLMVLAGLLIGIGLLRWKPAAHTLAVVYYGFSLLNLAGSILLPGAYPRIQALMQEMLPAGSRSGSELTEQFFWFGILLGLLGTAVPLWFLITRRQAFLDACQPEPPTHLSSPGSLPNPPS